MELAAISNASVNCSNSPPASRPAEAAVGWSLAIRHGCQRSWPSSSAPNILGALSEKAVKHMEKARKPLPTLWVSQDLPSPSRLWLQVDRWTMCREALGLTNPPGTHRTGSWACLRGYSGTGCPDLRTAGERTRLSHSVVCQRSPSWLGFCPMGR